jgi:hypothetical protein
MEYPIAMELVSLPVDKYCAGVIKKLKGGIYIATATNSLELLLSEYAAPYTDARSIRDFGPWIAPESSLLETNAPNPP